MTQVQHINQIRDYKATYTPSEVYLPGEGERFCWTLEDVARPVGTKFPGETCIPEGVYDVSVSVSTRFNKEMIMLSNQDNGYEIKRDGVSFKGIRVHGGNKISQTHGCPLANFTNNHDGTMFGRASDALLVYIKKGMAEGIRYRWVISSEQVST